MIQNFKKGFMRTLLFPIFAVFALPAVALAGWEKSSGLLKGELYFNDVGPALFYWASLVAAAIIFFLTFNYMKGGYLARPLLLIGAGALINAGVGLLSPFLFLGALEWVWVGNLAMIVCIIMAVFWMEKLFRATNTE